MRDKEQIGIVLCIHGLVRQSLKIDQQAEANVGFHHVRELIPDDQEAIVVRILGQFLLHLKEPGTEFLALQADVDAGITQHVLNLTEGAGVLGDQIGQEFVHRGRKGRQLGVLTQNQLPHIPIVLDVVDVIVEVGFDIQFQACFCQRQLDFTLHLQGQVVLVGYVVLTIQRDREKTLLLAQVEKRLPQGVILGICILLVHVVRNLRHLIAKEVLDYGGGVRLTSSVSTFNPEGLVDVGVVVEHGIDNPPQNVVKLLVGDKHLPGTILFSLDVVSCLLAP